LSAISLLVLLLSLYGLVRSYWRGDWISVQSPIAGMRLITSLGRFRLEWTRPPSSDSNRRQHWKFTQESWPVTGKPDAEHMSGGGLVDLRFAGFTFQAGELRYRFSSLTIPGVVVVLAAAVLPLRFAFLWR